jgi:hypothetical protein
MDLQLNIVNLNLLAMDSTVGKSNSDNTTVDGKMLLVLQLVVIQLLMVKCS